MLIFDIFPIVFLSVWLGYMNWRARIVKGEQIVETNPVWGFFDDRGFERIQFALIPALAIALALFYSYTGNKYGIGVLTGLVFLNALFDAINLNKVEYFEDTPRGKYSVKTEMDIGVLRRSFKDAITGSFVLMVSALVTMFIAVGVAIAGPVTVLTSAPGIAVIGGTVLFFYGFTQFIDLEKVIMFKGDRTISGEGLPMKTELTEEWS